MAADVILTQLVIKARSEPFTADLLATYVAEGEEAETLQHHGKKINDVLYINHCKHMDDGEDGFVEFENLDDAALAAILKAVVNYIRIEGHQKDLVQAFHLWAKDRLDLKKYNVDLEPNRIPGS